MNPWHLEGPQDKKAVPGKTAGGELSLLPAGRLKHGNMHEDPTRAPRCGARSRRSGKPCRAPAIRGKRRCRMHGGLSTGPRTAEVLERSRRANWKHGRYSQEAKNAQAEAALRQHLSLWA